MGISFNIVDENDFQPRFLYPDKLAMSNQNKDILRLKESLFHQRICITKMREKTKKKHRCGPQKTADTSAEKGEVKHQDDDREMPGL